LSDTAEPAPRKLWYENVWVALLAGYVFAPLGLYLMWRYQPWPLWLKVALTAFGLTAMVVGTYLSTKYGPVSVF
jgi:ABC-type Mn2+/Zn2+ transport system permease subunit